MFKISIPKPCFEGWENMLPNEQGRYCNACAKTVVDFSVMSDEAVQQYFITNYGKQICGRFKNTQIQRIQIDLPENIFRIQLPFWKKFFIAFLIIYGASFFSIDTTIAGMPYHASNVFYEKLQGEQIVKKQIKKKIHHRKKYQLTFLDMSTSGLVATCSKSSTEISGYTEIKEIVVFPPEAPSFINSNENTTADTITTIKKNTNSNSRKKEPTPKLPDSNTAFILPTALAIRKPSSKKKKA